MLHLGDQDPKSRNSGLGNSSIVQMRPEDVDCEHKREVRDGDGSLNKLNLSVDYIAPPSSRILVAKGKVTKKGKSIAYCTAEIFDEDKTLIASGRSIFKLYNREKNKS